MSDSLYTAAYILQIREKYRIYWETVQHAITACYWTAMVDVLTFPNGYVSPCFTLNAQDAQKKEFINQLSGLIFFFLQRLWLLLLQNRILRKWIGHYQNRRPVSLFLQILWTNTMPVSSYHQIFWHMTQKLGKQWKLFHAIFHTD